MVEDFRIEKLEKLIELGVNPYPYSFERTHNSADISGEYDKHEGAEVAVAGRIMRLRSMGSIRFIDLFDHSGKIQVLIRDDNATKKSIEIASLLDIGDIIGARGIITKTKKGEISVDVKEISVLSKSLRSMPEKFHGLQDTETRYRKRYLDFMMNPNARSFFSTRASILKYIRDFLDRRGYIEFETPVLQHVYGGAFAKPFITRYNALDSNAYLRISDELYLKRLIIGGFEKVYEVSKDFRNEDIDSTHNPEFTQVELYEAYKDYEDYMGLTETLLGGMVKEIFGDTEVEYQGRSLSFKPKFKRIYWVDELEKRTGIDLVGMSDKEASTIAKKEGLTTPVNNSIHVADALFDKYIRPDLFEPTFIVDFPSYMCPLAKDKRGRKGLSERFELFIAGYEEGNCYSELTNPIEQRKKFEQQVIERKKGDYEAPPNDEDFLEAIEFGLPPTAGLGIAIDRLAMILTNNTSLKEVIAFPAVRPEASGKTQS